jgi:galactokinase
MTSSGFGNCPIALVEDEAADTFVDKIRQNYKTSASLKPEIFSRKTANGVDEMF